MSVRAQGIHWHGHSFERAQLRVKLRAGPRVMVGVQIRGTQTINDSQTGLKGMCICE